MPNTWTKKHLPNEPMPDNVQRMIYFGVELEMVSEDEDFLVEAIDAQREFRIEVGSDGSLWEIDGYHCDTELRVHPCSWGYWCANMPVFARLLRQWSKHAISGIEANAGLHVHVSNVFSDAQLSNMLQLVYNNPFEFACISARDDCSLSEWASLKLYTLDDYCYNVERVGCSGEEILKEGMVRNHHSAVCITPFGTLEWRLFAGTLVPAEFSQRLRVIHAATQFACIPELTTHDMTWKNFRRWVNTQRYARSMNTLLKQGVPDD